MDEMYRILLVEDLPSDAALAEIELKKALGSFSLKVVETENDFLEKLRTFNPHLVISDFQLPSFNGLNALKIVLSETKITPVIILTGSMNEDTAVDCMKAGATDYVIKEHIRRLGPAVLNALDQRNLRIQKHEFTEMLKQNEAKYRYMFANNPQPMWIYDLETLAILEVNEAAVTHYGYTRNEFLSMTLKDIRPPEDIPALLKDVEITKRTYNPAGEWRHLKKNGELINVEIVSHTVTFNGRPARHVLIIDITEKKRALRDLEKSEEKYRTIFENVQDVFYQTNLEGRILEISPSIKYFSEFDRNELIDKFVPDIYADPGDREALLKEIEMKGEIRDYPLRLKTKAGDLKYTSINARLITDNDGNPHHIDGAIRDITERTLAQKQVSLLGKAIDNSSASIIITDRDGRIEYVNRGFTELTGYTSDEVKGKNPRILNSGNHPAPFFRELWETILSGEDWQGEILNRKKSGELYWENAIISPMIDNAGEITHFIAVKENVSDKKELIDNLIKAKEKAEESDKLKTAFLHNISHEIRTPLNAIIGFSGLLDQPDLTKEERQNFIDIIFQSNNQLLSIINDILNISSIEVGQVKLKQSTVNIDQVLNTLLHQFLPEAQRKNIELKITSGAGVKTTGIITDEGKLIQVLSNLLSNAVKFTASGSIEVKYEIKDKNILFSVSDTGIGIFPEEVNKIFDRFYQVDKAVSRTYGGTGLGLSISQAYVEMMGGRIWVESVPGSGSVFYFTIPMNISIRKDDTGIETLPEKGKKNPEFTAILVAEDEESNFAMIKTFLRDRPFKILRAVNGSEAVDIYKRYQSETGLILMDIKMPVMDGYEAASEILKINPMVPIIGQSAFAHQSDRALAIEIGFVDYLTKPFNKEQLITVIGKYFKY